MNRIILNIREDGIVGDRMEIREDKELFMVRDEELKELSEEGERRVSDYYISHLP